MTPWPASLPRAANLDALLQVYNALSDACDADDAAQIVARFCAQQIGVLCTVDTLENGRWRRLAQSGNGFVHTGEGLQDVCPWSHDPPPFLARFLSDGEPYLHQSRAFRRGPPAAWQSILLARLAGIAPEAPFCALGIPLMAGGYAQGLVLLWSPARLRPLLREHTHLAKGLCQRLAVALDNERLLHQSEQARQEAETARARCQFLSMACDIFNGTTNWTHIKRELARLCVSELADACLVHLLHAKTGHHVISQHRQPHIAQQLARLLEDSPELVSLWPQVTEPPVQPAAAAMADGAWQQVDGPSLPAPLADVLQPKFVFFVPLYVREQRIGRVTLVRCEADALPFSDSDMALAEELVRRAAHAIDHSWLLDDLREAVSTRDEFLSIASHELRTPLTALNLQVAGAERLLRRQQASNDAAQNEALLPLRGKIAGASRQIARLQKTIDDIMDATHIASGDFHLQLETLSLNELCADVIERWRNAATAAHCTLRCHAQGDIFGVFDRLRLEQLLGNLLDNALKYGAGKPIDVRLRLRDGFVDLAVRDYGIGVEVASLGRIFERFERAVSAREFGGFGLGLFVARQIAEAHGGTIGVHSVAGKGAEFSVCLPHTDSGLNEA